MRNIQLCLTIVGLLLLASCDNSTKKTSSGARDKIMNPMNIQKGGDFGSLQTIRTQAKALIDFRISQNGNPLAMVTYGYWHPEFAFNDGEFSKEGQYAGHWLKFNEDFSYEYGKYERTDGRGKYHLRIDDFQLILLDDDDEIEPKIWEARHNGEQMAWIGTHEFGIQNGMQIKMIPLETKPVRG